MPYNPALTIDRDKREYHLARLKAGPAQDAAKRLKDLLEARMPEVEPIDVLIDVDNDTDFLRHFLQRDQGRYLPPAVQRRNVLAALVAVGCNIGPSCMAAASRSMPTRARTRRACIRSPSPAVCAKQRSSWTA